MIVGIYEAGQKLSQLVEGASKGEEIMITCRGREQARLVPMPAERGRNLKDIFKLHHEPPAFIFARAIRSRA